MSSPPISPIRRAWYRWKALRLPWRKRFLVGLDLNGNTFWEFTDKLSPDPRRMRRIVQYPRSANMHYSDVSSHITPAWHQWLRHTRVDPPSLTEQSQDVIRQANLKVLAAAADARWAAKPSLLDMPGRARGQPVPPLGLKDGGGYTREQAVRDGRTGGRMGERGAADMAPESERNEDDRRPSGTPSSEIQMQQPDTQRHPLTRGERAPKMRKDSIEDPWKKARGGPSEEWQPTAWDPNSLSVKR